MKCAKWLLVCACVSFIGACGESDGGFAVGEELAEYGEACGGSNGCVEGLDCVEGVCVPRPTRAEGQACTYTEGCMEGLFCDPALGVCAQSGDAGEGEGCGETADCEAGLVCMLEGFSGTCMTPGEGGRDTSCEETTDCAAGLNCVADLRGEPGAQVCDARQPAPTFRGATCAENTEGEVRALFELPADDADGEATEFYRLPFPNDIRLKDGHPDMSGHPTPGPGYVGVDIVERYLGAVGRSQDRFGLNQTAYFRFSNAIDFGTLTGSGDNATVEYVDIDSDSPHYNSRRGMSWRYGSGPRSYICQNWLTVRPQAARPLRAETTYAVVVREGVKDGEGNDVVASEDFKSLLADAKPDDLAQAAWDAYQPLRDWISEQGIDKNTLISAAVFTTGNPHQVASKLREAARASTPALTEATLCEEATTSPCDDGLEGDAHVRGCMGVSEAYHEIHAKLGLPVFQAGDAPYLEAGGAISLADGAPQKVRDEDVCAAMTVPKATMPDGGWPLLIYAHGTGGSFRSHVDQISGLVTSMAIDGQQADQQTGMVVLGWDQVLHFSRRGDSDAHPNGLVYNYANPDAARGNFLQGAADIHALVAFAESFSLTAEESPTGEALRFDPTKIYFMGHSQGGTTGPLALPFDDTVSGTILSGAGAQIGRALLGKTSPLNAKAALMAALQDADVGLDHPVISILQGYFDPVDPLNYGDLLAARQIDEVTFPSHVFHLYGVGDTYTPPDAIEILAHVMRIPYIGEAEFGVGTADTIELPVSANLTTSAGAYTAFGRQYTPDGYDGHFVAWRNTEAMDDVVEFLGSAIVAEDGVPTIAD